MYGAVSRRGAAFVRKTLKHPVVSVLHQNAHDTVSGPNAPVYQQFIE